MKRKTKLSLFVDNINFAHSKSKRGEGSVGGLGSTDWQLQNSHGDVKCSAGNTVSNTVITACGARWVVEISGGALCVATMLHT